MDHHLFVLNENGDPIAEPDVLKWGSWMESHGRHVADTRLGKCRVSTIFLGIDHSWRPGAIPILFETLIFGGPFDGEMVRYATRTGAKQGHDKMVLRAFGRKVDSWTDLIDGAR